MRSGLSMYVASQRDRNRGLMLFQRKNLPRRTAVMLGNEGNVCLLPAELCCILKASRVGVTSIPGKSHIRTCSGRR